MLERENARSKEEAGAARKELNSGANEDKSGAEIDHGMEDSKTEIVSKVDSTTLLGIVDRYAAGNKDGIEDILTKGTAPKGSVEALSKEPKRDDTGVELKDA